MSEHKSRIAIKDVPQLLDEFEEYVERAYFDKNLLPDSESPIPGSSIVLEDPQQALKFGSRAKDFVRIGRSNAVAQARMSEVLWVEDVMAAIAVEAAQSLSSVPEEVIEASLGEREIPAMGVVIFERGTGFYLPIDIAGGRHYHCEVIGYVKTSPFSGSDFVLLNIAAPDKKGSSIYEFGSFYMLADVDLNTQKKLKNLVRATYLLMGDSAVARVGTETVGEVTKRKHGKRKIIKAGYPVRTVQVGAHLLANSIPDHSAADEHEPGEKKWTLKHRVITRGHWKRVAYGKGRSLRRVQWIMPYVRGPEGADLVVRPVVKVWRSGSDG
ncbi:hypothetical protein HMPREF2527_00020 [Rothia sp. HMSC071B01]|uniref:hypothetical protein n=1 Tax=Rothia TaxID=32207 RepID=UPI0008C92E03|nr:MULTISPECIES: hypothetical protein [Rothia]OFN75765.1 hypothetical protein HMPREF2527_00020 [Rothia sp. HMSC071B01]